MPCSNVIMNVIIVVNAYIGNASQLSQAERIGEELNKLGVNAKICRNFNLARIEDGKIVAPECDFVVYLDKDKVAARLLERAGRRLFNRAEAIEVCDDKMLTHIRLADCGIAMPDCLYAPLCYSKTAQPDKMYLADVSRSLGFPLVAKACYGSLGAGVELIENADALTDYERRNILLPHFYQRYIDCGRGEDIRVILVGGKYVCAMRRINDRDFRSNIELGGRGERYKADEALIALCERVAGELGLDYCGMDILTDRDGRRYVCEVNSNAFFAAAERVCGVNIAGAFAKYMTECMKQ